MASLRTPHPALPLSLAVALVGSAPAALVPPAAAQEECPPEVEPNDAAEAAPSLAGAFCLSGVLPSGDQDLLVWEVPLPDAGHTWTVGLTGTPGVLTLLEAHVVSSPPGSPVATGRELFELRAEPDATEPAVLSDVLVPPGRMVLAVGRSDAPGGEPAEPGYVLEARPGSPLPPSGDSEPNDGPEEASAVSGAFRLSGDVSGSRDVFSWTLSEPGSVAAWALEARGALGAGVAITLRDPEGSMLASSAAEATGLASLRDLRLTPGTYHVEVSGGAPEGSSPYVLEALVEAEPLDAEPNDRPELAAAVTPGVPLVGRLVGPQDVDLFRLPPETDPGSLLEVLLVWRSGKERELCLRTLDLRALQCRKDDRGIRLKDLLLPDDAFILAVAGPGDAADHYVLRIDRTSAPAPDVETEPNDLAEIASRLPSDRPMQAAGAPGDVDIFETIVIGGAQLWQLDVVGSGIEAVEWLHADGTAMADAEVEPDGSAATVHDLYFVPGARQSFRVRASGGDYRLELSPLGPPDPNGEREPNDGLSFAESLPVGVRHTGRLPSTVDVDEWRFSIAASEHLFLTLDAPSDADLVADLRDDAGMGIRRHVSAGETLTEDLALREGDYRLVLRPERPGDGRYGLQLDRADPFLLAADQEPNDSPGWASPIAGAGRVEGTGRQGGDHDWYRLPPLSVAGAIRLTDEGGADRVALFDGDQELPLIEEADGVTFRSERLEVRTSAFVRVIAFGPYALRIDGLPEVGAGRIDPLAVELVARIDHDEVAASWPAGQRLTGSVTASGDEVSPSGLRFDATTSDRRWSVSLGDGLLPDADSPALEIPIEVLVPADVPADVPVRLTFRAGDERGAQRTAWVEVTPRRDTPPVAPFPAWTVPDALLGGLDVASLALGAAVVPSVDPDGEAALHDGFAPRDGGLARSIPGLPVTLTVDLAGEDPIPVAGTIINAHSDDPSFRDSPIRFELDLSEDGASWEEVLAGDLARTTREQAYVLEAPVQARFARLRIPELHSEGESRISLGEWKVVAVPGFPAPLETVDLAETVRGGHVVWLSPQPSRIELAEAMIDEDPTRMDPIRAEPGTPVSWVLGFHEDRAALVTAFEWEDPLGSDAVARFERIELDISVDGPLGPFERLGTWVLERSADGHVRPFQLEAPTWARFVRFTTDPLRKDARSVELPGAIRILETPSGPDYRSVLGQWGLGERAGPLEWSAPRVPDVVVDADDDGPEATRPLQPGATARGRVHQDIDSDWYAVEVPEDHHALRAVVGGAPFVGVELVLRDAHGSIIPTVLQEGEEPGTVVYEAPVEPMASYVVEVRQPPSSVVVTFDTSASVGGYFDAIVGGIRRFARGVVPGREGVQILPFDHRPLLRDWSDQPHEIEAAIGGFFLSESSSGAEENLARATRDLAARRGARAVLLMTDAASSSYGSTVELWDELAAVGPLVFAVQTGGLNEAPPGRRHHLMQDWAASSGGVYRYARSDEDIVRAFDHLATWLRRPAGYQLAVETSPEQLPPPAPARLSVAAPLTPEGRPGVRLGTDVAVAFVLDTSGSMLEPFEGERRIDLAKRVLVDLVTTELPEGTPVALRVFDDARRSCETELAVPLGPLDPDAMARIIASRKVPRSVRTPLAAAIESVASDLAGVTGPRIVVLISDGRESCGGDPVAAVRALVKQGFDVRLNVVGLALGERRDRKAMARLARLGNGTYFDARDPADLAAAMARALGAPFRVLDDAGGTVGEGTVGGGPLELPAGTYTVLVASEPETRFEDVHLQSGSSLELVLPVDAPPTPREGEPSADPEAQPEPPDDEAP